MRVLVAVLDQASVCYHFVVELMIVKTAVDWMSVHGEILELISDPSAKRRAIEDAFERFVSEMSDSFAQSPDKARAAESI